MSEAKPLIGIGADLQVNPGKRTRVFVYSSYIESLREAGAIPVIIPPQPENAALLVEQLDGLLLAGGDDCDPSVYGAERHETVEPMDPRRQANEFSLAEASRQRGIPTLGVCLGMQMLNVAAGGTLIQDIPSEVSTTIEHVSEPEDRARHDVFVDPSSKLAGVVGASEVNVNSSHHQAVKDAGKGLKIVAHASDGIIEGLEDPTLPFYLGVQWHPEDMKGERSAASIFGAFVAAAKRFASEKRQQASELSQLGRKASE